MIIFACQLKAIDLAELRIRWWRCLFEYVLALIILWL